jgi:lactate permease
MQAAQVPVDLLHWILATLSIVALLIFLLPLRWRAPEAGPMAMFTAAIVALLAFRTPWETLAVASAKGVWDAIFILYVIWPALLLYQITKQAGAYDALRQGIAHFSRNELFIILALSWVFASFLQGIAGFGAPVAVVVPLLLARGSSQSTRWLWGLSRTHGQGFSAPSGSAGWRRCRSPTCRTS